MTIIDNHAGWNIEHKDCLWVVGYTAENPQFSITCKKINHKELPDNAYSPVSTKEESSHSLSFSPLHNLGLHITLYIIHSFFSPLTHPVKPEYNTTKPTRGHWLHLNLTTLKLFLFTSFKKISAAPVKLSHTLHKSLTVRAWTCFEASCFLWKVSCHLSYRWSGYSQADWKTEVVNFRLNLGSVRLSQRTQTSPGLINLEVCPRPNNHWTRSGCKRVNLSTRDSIINTPTT